MTSNQSMGMSSAYPLPFHKHEVPDLQRNLKSVRLGFHLALMLFKF